MRDDQTKQMGIFILCPLCSLLFLIIFLSFSLSPAVTIISGVIMLILFVSELQYYLTKEVSFLQIIVHVPKLGFRCWVPLWPPPHRARKQMWIQIMYEEAKGTWVLMSSSRSNQDGIKRCSWLQLMIKVTNLSLNLNTYACQWVSLGVYLKKDPKWEIVPLSVCFAPHRFILSCMSTRHEEINWKSTSTLPSRTCPVSVRSNTDWGRGQTAASTDH